MQESDSLVYLGSSDNSAYLGSSDSSVYLGSSIGYDNFSTKLGKLHNFFLPYLEALGRTSNHQQHKLGHWQFQHANQKYWIVYSDDQ